jgi:hypothetical protein
MFLLSSLQIFDQELKSYTLYQNKKETKRYKSTTTGIRKYLSHAMEIAFSVFQGIISRHSPSFKAKAICYPIRSQNRYSVAIQGIISV